MPIERLKAQVESDLRIDNNNLNVSASTVPLLYSKYLNLLMDTQMKMSMAKADYDSAYSKKYLYYRNDYNVILKNKAEIDILISGDEDLSSKQFKLEYMKNMARYLESVLKMVSGLSFLIRDSIEWQKFKEGV
ncbi:MAG: recombination mediator protein UvsY [Ghiorsea sp.]